MNIVKKFSVFIVIFSFFTLPLLIYAQSKIPPSGGSTIPPTSTNISAKIDNPFNCGGQKDCTLMDLIVALLNRIVMPIAAVGVVLFIIYAGFKFVIAQGNEKKVTEAKQILLWGLIGAGILLGAAGISKVVQNTVTSVVNPL